MSEELKRETREEWRSLGFFYDYDDAARRWIIRGSRDGLRRFAAILRDYAQNSSHAPLSEHEHYGPYSYLKLVTWSSPKVVADGIYGRLADFQRLADTIEAKLLNSAPGARVQLDADYSSANEARLVLEVAPDDFDPAEADMAIA